MSVCRYIVGDVFDVLAELEADSVDLVLTSPPFLALRSYLPDDHPNKDREIGSEANPAEFVDTLLRLVAELGRVLAPHGSIAIELGDTYSGSGGAGGDYQPTGLRDGQPTFKGSKRAGMEGRGGPPRKRIGSLSGWPEAKSMALIPELFLVGLAYGINPLTGEASPAGRWRVRNVVKWCRTNPPVGALADKYRPATSDMVIATRAKDRWFDLDAVRVPYSENTNRRTPKGVDEQERRAKTPPDSRRDTLADRDNDADGLGAPPLDWWQINGSTYSGSHYAVWPPELCTVPIKSMCPRYVCLETGKPWVADPMGDFPPEGSNEPWPRRRGVVLDPFGGSGTTGMVATGMGRDAVLIDLDDRNADLARERIGMFVTVEHHRVGSDR